MTRWMVVASCCDLPRRRPGALTKNKPPAYRGTTLPIFTPVQMPQEARERPVRFDGPISPGGGDRSPDGRLETIWGVLRGARRRQVQGGVWFAFPYWGDSDSYMPLAASSVSGDRHAKGQHAGLDGTVWSALLRSHSRNTAEKLVRPLQEAC